MNRVHGCLVLFLIYLFFPASLYGQLIQNVQSRNPQSLDGKWNYIVDPYEVGYYDNKNVQFLINFKKSFINNSRSVSLLGTA